MDIFEEIVRLRKAGRKGALATIVEVQGSIPSHESSKILIRDDGSIAGTVSGGAFAVREISTQRVVNHRRPRTLFPRHAVDTSNHFAGQGEGGFHFCLHTTVPLPLAKSAAPHKRFPQSAGPLLERI